MKFNKLYSQYKKLFVEGVLASEHLPVLQGDQVTFRKGWEKMDCCKAFAQTSTGERIREMVSQGKDPLIATSINSQRATAYGAHGSQEQNSTANEVNWNVTVGQQYALGLYKNVVQVPMACLERVDNGNNLTPLSQNQNGKDYKQNYKGEEPTIDKTLSDPTSQTHASWK